MSSCILRLFKVGIGFFAKIPLSSNKEIIPIVKLEIVTVDVTDWLLWHHYPPFALNIIPILQRISRGLNKRIYGLAIVAL